MKDSDFQVQEILKTAIITMMTMPLCLPVISVAMNGFVINKDMMITSGLVLAATCVLYIVQYWFVHVAKSVIIPLAVVPVIFWATVSYIGTAMQSIQDAGEYAVMCIMMAGITYILGFLTKR